MLKTRKPTPTKRQLPDKSARSPPKRVKTEDSSCFIPSSDSDDEYGKKEKENFQPFASSSTKTTTPDIKCSWTIPGLLAELEGLRVNVAENIVQLFEQENTIPFICRYRKHLVDSLEPDKMREIKSSLNQIMQLKTKVTSVTKTLEKENLLTMDLQETICKVKTMEELNHIYELYKPARKKSLVEKAINLGLMPVAEQVLSGQSNVNFSRYINSNVEGLQNVTEVRAGVEILISSVIMKNAKILDHIRETRKTSRIELQSTQTKLKKSEAAKMPASDPTKYELYFNFKSLVSQIRPHQILAINRGEKNKILTVKIVIPKEMQMNFKRFVVKLYGGGDHDYGRKEFLEKIIHEMYIKKVQPLITKEVRRELTDMAEKASIEVFANNLRQLLLMSPVKGEKILGIDPGFSHGCKLAMISEQGTVLETATIYPHTKRDDSSEATLILLELLRKHNCRIVGLGNGTACRETETLLSKVMAVGNVNFTYCIVSEQGASIYSCGDVAKKEFPKLDVNLISAISIARRLHNPLAELVKVEPKHLGVGMYQHDISDKLLAESLHEIVVECVSFVGVDLNTASEHLLQFVAGLTPARARNIIEYRQKKGSITSREELKKIKLIGEKTFTQCAGFVRVEEKTAGKQIDPLDGTWVHPESYHIARAIIEDLSLNLNEIGRFHFIDKIRKFAENTVAFDTKVRKLKTPVECLRSVCDALQRMPTVDYRDDLNRRPHFKQGLTKISDLKVGTVATGSISNVTHFGCFVDLGVEKNGLIHIKNQRGLKPGIGDSVEVSILSVDVDTKKINLILEKIL
ncbi:S1 RNA-binding domain-containing protein 1 [Sergentomyia squamirostris]